MSVEVRMPSFAAAVVVVVEVSDAADHQMEMGL
jgi:hypothetical protein